MKNLSVENAYTRQEAKALSKKHLWKLVGMIAIVYGIGFGITFVGELLIGGVMTTSTTTSSSTALNSVAASSSASISATNVVAMSLVSLLLTLVCSLVTGGLFLGMTNAMIDLCRGKEDVTVGAVFSRMGQCLKAFGLSWWVGLKSFLWALPGFALIVVGLVVGAATTNVQSIDEAAPTLFLLIAGYALIIALMIPAVFRYMMSTYVLADEKDRGIRECVNMSKTMMKGHKWQAFKLVVPYILILYAWPFGVALVLGLVTASLPESPAVMLVMSILPLVLALVAIVYLALRMGLSYCLFYLKRRKELEPGSVEEAAE